MENAPHDLIILAGGKATRMGALGHAVPKAIMPVAGAPFLLHMAQEIIENNIVSRLFLSIEASKRPAFDLVIPKIPLKTEIIEENAPMGTGGAILDIVQRRLDLSMPFFVMNGDVIFQMELESMVDKAQKYGACMCATHVDDVSRFGAMDIDDAGLVTGFHEKAGETGPGFVSTGLYCFSPHIFSSFPVRPCSFEKDIAPTLVKKRQIVAHKVNGPFIDIGTPESYKQAQNFIRQHNLDALRKTPPRSKDNANAQNELKKNTGTIIDRR